MSGRESDLLNCEDHTVVLKHARKSLSHAVVFLMVMLTSTAISKDFGILTRMLYAAFLAEQGVALCIVADPAFASGSKSYAKGDWGDIERRCVIRSAGLCHGSEPFRVRSSARENAFGARQSDPRRTDHALKFDRCAQAKNSGVGNAARGRIERIKRAAGGVKDILEIRLNEKAGDNLGLIGKLEGHLIVADCQGGRRKERRIGVASTRCRRDP